MLDFFPPIWNGTLREHYLVLFGAAGSIALVTGLIGAWLGARLGTRRVVQRLLEALDAREGRQLAPGQLAEMNRAIDVIAIEVERLAEGQRFTAKLLAERAAPPLPVKGNRAPNEITPH